MQRIAILLVLVLFSGFALAAVADGHASEENAANEEPSEEHEVPINPLMFPYAVVATIIVMILVYFFLNQKMKGKGQIKF